MLVSKGTKEVFDASNGWSLCLQGVKREEDVKSQFMKSYREKAEPLVENASSATNEQLEQFRSLLDDADLMQSVSARLLHVRNKLIPAASLLAATYCGEHVPHPDFLEGMKLCNEGRFESDRCIITLLESKVSLAEGRRLMQVW